MEEESKNLLPTVDVPDFVDEEEDEEYDVDYKPSPMWDLEKGDFVRTAANNVPMNDGYTECVNKDKSINIPKGSQENS